MVSKNIKYTVRGDIDHNFGYTSTTDYHLKDVSSPFFRDLLKELKRQKKNGH